MMVVMCQAGGDRYLHNRSCRLRGWGDNGLQSQSLPGIPFVLSVGALDIVNFGNKSSVPSQFANRKLHLHNDQVSISRVYHNSPPSWAVVTDKMWVIRYPFSPFVCEECLV
jgi:hypothetical protein